MILSGHERKVEIVPKVPGTVRRTGRSYPSPMPFRKFGPLLLEICRNAGVPAARKLGGVDTRRCGPAEAAE
jgi:hypothetical protein